MAKRVPPLTATGVARLKPNPEKTIEVVDGAVPGLRLRITPAGTRTWSLNIRAKGVMRRFDVGADLGLSEARQRAEDLRRQVRDGADPTAEKRAARLQTLSARQGIGTFEAVIDTYFKDGTGAELRTRNEQQQRIKSVFAAHLAGPAVEIASTELQRTIDAHCAKVSAARAASYLVPVINWAVKRDHMRGNFDLEKPLSREPKQKVLTESELVTIVPHLTDAYGLCSYFILLTGARRHEAQFATWEQLDLTAGTWTVPAQSRKDTRSPGRRRGKRRHDHVVPLSRQAVALLETVKDAESQRRQIVEDDRPIAGADYVFVGQRGGCLGNWDRWLKALASKTGISGWSAHSLRRTTATMAGDLGVPPHVISVLLGHSNIGGDLVSGYNQSRYGVEHAKSLQMVADRLDEISPVGSELQTPSTLGAHTNVVRLHA